ncbi:MAG: Rpn family recombination-promoting nuclease/putative transposase [Planctomycetaceae bacterium]|jgi:predicted transposase/invertase (TIGR01784 family)|nr:Rpn family recombination-promoting nuclease/putative transposase [Planctomycetaceae bacterium]
MTIDKIIIPVILPPSDDGVFKTLFTRPESKPALCSVISGFLRRAVCSVEVINSELSISDSREKQERFDVNCMTDGGEQIDVEMQSLAMSGDSFVGGHANLKSRIAYNLCDLHAKQAASGDEYRELLCSYVLMFCNFPIHDKQTNFVHHNYLCDEYGDKLTEKIGAIIVDLTMLGTVLKKTPTEMTDEEKWSIFFRYANERKHRNLINTIISNNKEIQMANEILTSISQNEKERAHYHSRMLFQMDEQSNRAAERRMGREEGLKEGRERQVRDTVSMMLASDYSVSEIARINKLPISIVEKIRDEMENDV